MIFNTGRLFQRYSLPRRGWSHQLASPLLPSLLSPLALLRLRLFLVTATLLLWLLLLLLFLLLLLLLFVTLRFRPITVIIALLFLGEALLLILEREEFLHFHCVLLVRLRVHLGVVRGHQSFLGILKRGRGLEIILETFWKGKLSNVSLGTYLIPVFSQDFDLFVIEVAHREALHFMVNLPVYPGACGAHEYPEIHHRVCRPLGTLSTMLTYLFVAVEALPILLAVLQLV